MTKLIYLDCPTGIAGDMCLGALVDGGVPLDYLKEMLATLGNSQEYELRAELVHRNGQQATKVHVDLRDEHHPHHHDHAPTRHLPEIEQMILGAKLPPRVTDWSLAVFRRLAAAEGAVHGIAPEKVHFHEVGATDAIADIVGTCLGLDWLGMDRLYCSALPTGGGTIRAAHGRLPVPPPAVLKLFQMRQVPIYSNGIEREMVTPTGAAIATTLATDFGSPPAMTLHRVGLGAGSKELPLPNILRMWIGESSELRTSEDGGKESSESLELEEISVLETQLDDLSPQAIAYVYDLLFAAGALDVFTSAIAMKKSRLGVLLTVICHPEQLPVCENILFRETTTLGIRRLTQQRAILQRQIEPVQTQYGTIRIKVGRGINQTLLNVQPEYEDCAAIAKANHLPWKEVHDLALDAWKKK